MRMVLLNGRTARSLRLCAFGIMLALAIALFPHASGNAAPPDWTGRAAETEDSPFAAGAKVYRENCAACHDGGINRAPQRLILQDMTPAAIHRALTDGVMREQAAALTPAQRIATAEYLAGRELDTQASAAPLKMCDAGHARFDLREPPAFSGWGLDPASTHAIPARLAGLNRRNAGRLTLKWAFGFPDTQRMRSQPALAGGAILVGTHSGSVFALDRATGCLRWKFDAAAEVRTGIVVSSWRAGDSKARPLAFFGDVVGNAYGVEASTGRLVWKISADDHPAATLTGTPALHDGTLYVPVSSLEEASAAAPGYACCNFRGSILALEAATGAVKWRTYLVDAATVRGPGSDGIEQQGPSGVAVWSAPAIDVKRGQLYVATGDNYSVPATDLSDAIVAIDLASGRINWHYQALTGDSWNVACYVRANANCPEGAGPDFDFGAGTVLAKTQSGRDMVLAGQKSGIAYGIDPDSGKLVWQQRVGRGGMAGGIYFGIAATGGRVFLPVSDRPAGAPSDYPASPGIHALDIATGEFVWRAPAPDVCAGRLTCFPGYGGAISVTPDLVLAGADDGHIRILDTKDGTVLWDMDVARNIPTVNGVPARGGAISGGVAPIAWGGDLIVASGYGFSSKMPGNVLLVFGVE